MIYITGDTHNITDMSNLSSNNMKLCCMVQGADFDGIPTAIVLGDFDSIESIVLFLFLDAIGLLLVGFD